MPELQEMTTQECWRRLGTEGMGRVGFDRGRGPRIHPVNYTVADQTVYVRTNDASEFGSFVRMFGDGALVSFQVDELDAARGERWSVLIAARVRPLSPEAEADLPPSRIPVPVPDGQRPVLVQLTPIEVTGRHLVEDD